MDLPPWPQDLDLLAGHGARVRLHRPLRPHVVLGRGSRPEVEVDLEAARTLDLPVYRRHGGGCAVVLDPGDLVVSLVTPASGSIDVPALNHALTSWLLEGLRRAGVEGVYAEGASDLALGDRKVAGACVWRSRDRVYYSASLLVDPDLDLMERLLPHPPREPAWRRGRSHRDFVGGLGSQAGVDVEDLRRALERVLAPPAAAARVAPA